MFDSKKLIRLETIFVQFSYKFFFSVAVNDISFKNRLQLEVKKKKMI